MRVRDVEDPEPPEEPQTQNRAEEENENRWRIYRQSSGTYAYALPGERKSGTYVCAATSLEAARNACQQRARDERYIQGRPAMRPPQSHANSVRREQRASLALDRLKNLRRGTPTAYACGHPRTLENTYGMSSGYGACRTCHREKARIRRANRRQAKGGES